MKAHSGIDRTRGGKGAKSAKKEETSSNAYTERMNNAMREIDSHINNGKNLYFRISQKINDKVIRSRYRVGIGRLATGQKTAMGRTQYKNAFGIYSYPEVYGGSRPKNPMLEATSIKEFLSGKSIEDIEIIH